MAHQRLETLDHRQRIFQQVALKAAESIGPHAAAHRALGIKFGQAGLELEPHQEVQAVLQIARKVGRQAAQ